MSCPETESLVRDWNRIHKQTSRALAAAPDDKLDWKPGEKMFTLRELLTHIPEAEAAIARSALAGAMQKVKLDLASAAVADIVSAFDSQHSELVEEVSKLTLDQLNEKIHVFGREMRRIVLLRGMIEHEIHHRGQLFTYLRLAGIEPPALY
ncbi:MAG: DinB family protein [Acidobacteriota bacterium]